MSGLALSEQVIGMAMDVHRHLGPGLLESAYEECLCPELEQGGIAFIRQAPVPVIYKGLRLDCAYRRDLPLEGELVVEIKAVDKLAPIHEAQLLTYLRLSGLRVGLLMNSNATRFKDGLRRMVKD